MYGRVQSIVHERFGPTLSQLCWLCVMSRLAVCDWLCVTAMCDWLCVTAVCDWLCDVTTGCV